MTCMELYRTWTCRTWKCTTWNCKT